MADCGLRMADGPAGALAVRLYVSGPMTGLDDFNRPAFAESAGFWRGHGFAVFNPGEVAVCDGWLQYVREDLRELLDCHALIALDGWERSKGAKIEANLAAALGLPVIADSAQTRRDPEKLRRSVRRRMKRIGWRPMQNKENEEAKR